MIRKFKIVALITFVGIVFGGCYSTKELENRIFSEGVNQYHKSGTAEWKKVNESITCDKGEGFIYSNKSYQYFHLTAEFLADEKVNSGIFFGCEGEEIGATSCYEANIWDNHPNQNFRTGSLVTRQAPLEIVETLGKWSVYEIKSEPQRIRIWINSILTVDHKVENVIKGPIIFQKFDEGKIQFRNIIVRPL